jgi:hypothetical protein
LLVEQPRTFPGQRARCQTVAFLVGIHSRQLPQNAGTVTLTAPVLLRALPAGPLPEGLSAMFF